MALKVGVSAGGGGLTSQILGKSRPQPVVEAPTPQTPPPSGGVSGAIKAAPIGPYSTQEGQGRVCVARYTLLTRGIYKAYQGPVMANAGLGNVNPWVLSDPVPPNKFWVVMKASAITVQDSGTGFDIGLWMVPPGAQPQASGPGNADDGTDKAHAFANYGALPGGNEPPIARGLRVDQTTEEDSSVSPATPIGVEVNFLRSQELYVPSGWRLMAYTGISLQGTGHTHNQLELRIFYAELDQSEDTQVL